MDVLFEDNHCLVVAKPAGWLTMGDATGDRTLLDQAKADLARRFHKPGAVYLGVVHRLDRPVSGIVLLARTSKAAARLAEQFRTRKVVKTYWAVVTGPTPPRELTLQDWLRKDPVRNRTLRFSSPRADAQEALLKVGRLEGSGQYSLVEVQPLTGRSHQIRAQLSGRSWPIVGDAKYGSVIPFVDGQIALHAVRLAFAHPVKPVTVTVECPPPASWLAWSWHAARGWKTPRVTITAAHSSPTGSGTGPVPSTDDVSGLSADADIE